MGMDDSASHKFIMEEGNNSQYPEAFGENDGAVSVSSAKWVCGDQALESLCFAQHLE